MTTTYNTTDTPEEFVETSVIKTKGKIIKNENRSNQHK